MNERENSSEIVHQALGMLNGKRQSRQQPQKPINFNGVKFKNHYKIGEHTGRAAVAVN